ncbi:MAG TPA: glycerophosphodiester phosphodiesterase [Acidimicrobiales bacterium]|jgi:glycerophosphoryl diester phosphodiesterase|nr:glycerophosphodiester phosphodiesterase [Acidimicrobiales bacterium]
MAPNPWLGRRVLNYAHQGGAREAPSSTLLAMRQAVAAGAHALELDVHATADRQLVVCHDATVDRTTDGAGAIANLTLADLEKLDNAYWWVPGEVVAPGRDDSDYLYRGRAAVETSLRVTPLRDVLTQFDGVFLNLDIKQTAPAVEPYEDLLASLLREFDRSDDVIVASFLDSAMAAFTAAAPEIPTSYPSAGTVLFWQAVQGRQAPPPTNHVALQVPATFDQVVVVDEPFVTAAHDLGVAVHVWTIDDAEEMERLIDLGVDGIMTDRPSVLDQVLRARGVGWRP